MISISAFNALLKTLEEPPPHVKFIFATTESHKVPATINSRCQRFNFRTLTVDDLIGGMGKILENEGIGATDEALGLIALEAQGSFRDGLSLLDQVISFTSESIDAQSVTQILGLTGRNSLGILIDAILERSPKNCLEILHQLFHQGSNPEQLSTDLLKHLRNLTVIKAIPSGGRPGGMLDATPAQIEEMERLAEKTGLEELQNLFSMAVKGVEEIRKSGDPWIALEMTLLRMASAPRLTDLASLVRMIKTGELKGKKPHAPGADPHRSGSEQKAENIKKNKPPKDSGKGSNGQEAARTTQTPESAPHPPRGPKNSAKASRFFIEEVRPAVEGSNDEIWAMVKKRIQREIDNPMVHTVTDHGSLISVGPSKVEIGFTKPFYRDQFSEKLDELEQLRTIFDEIFGDVRIEVLTLAEKTPLGTRDPYAQPDDGQSDLRRALKQEAIDHPITRAILKEFQGSSVEDIKIIKES